MSGLSAGDSRHLGNLARSMEIIAKVLTTLNENCVAISREISELAKANEPLPAPVQQTEIPTEPKWNVGDQVRVLNEESPWFGEIGRIVAKGSFELEVEFDELVTLTGGKVVNKKASFSPKYLHHMDAHLKPVPLGPEWYVGAVVRVIDKFTLMHDKIGKIVGLTHTDVDVVDLSSPVLSGGTFHPSQLELIPLEGLAVRVVSIDHDYDGQEGTIVESLPGCITVMMHDSATRVFREEELEIDWDTPRQHVCGKGCAGHTNDDPRVAIRNSPLADWSDNPPFEHFTIKRDGEIVDHGRMEPQPNQNDKFIGVELPPRFKMGVGEALTMNRPIPDPAQYDDFIRWVFEEAGRQGIDPKKITFVQGDQEGQALMRLNTDYLDSDTPPGFQVKLPKGLEVPSPSYMEEHFGHLDPPIKRTHQGFAHMDGCVNEDCEGNCPKIVKSDFLRIGVQSGSLSLQQALDIEEAEKKNYDDEGDEIVPDEGRIVSESGVNIPIIAPDSSDVAFSQLADKHDDTRD